MSDFWGTWRDDYSYEAPALDLEESLDLQGIGRRYIMPPDHDMRSLEHEIKRRVQWCDISMEERLRRAREYARILTGLNPCLREIKYNHDDLRQTWDFLLGATSGFSPSDMNWFIENQENHTRAAPAKKVEATLAQKFNQSAQVCWRPSPYTANLILRKMEEKRKNSIQPHALSWDGPT